MEEGKGEVDGGRRGVDFGGECTVPWADDVSWNCTLEPCMVSVTGVTPINSIFLNVKKRKNISFWGCQRQKKRIFITV